MPRLKSPAVYSVQGCESAPPADILKQSFDHLPLFGAARQAKRRRTGVGRGAAPPVDADRLSIVHNDSNPDKTEALQLFKVWTKGARADFPGLDDRRLDIGVPEEPKKSVRGLILGLTQAARLRMMRDLATVDQSAPSHTMALTLPGDLSNCSNPFAKECFLKLCKRATASRNPLIRSLGAFWKQELQKRGALHFHLLFWGVPEGQETFVRDWFAEQWNDLVCVDSSLEDRQAHLAVHKHASNFQLVRNFAGYFAKYVGKAGDDELTSSVPIPGKWWGRFNASNIPYSPVAESPLPYRVKVLAHRVARKIRKHRADEGKHRAIMRKGGLVSKIDNKPFFSRFEMQCGRVRPSSPLGKFFRSEMAKSGAFYGDAHLPRSCNFGTVILCGKDAPRLAVRILEYAINRSKSQSPF